MNLKEQKPFDSYLSISTPSKGLYKDNGSRFLAFAYPVDNEESIKDIINSLKKEFFDARHHCYAYKIGYKGDLWRINDDGEPSSTAGKPILGQILSNDLSDILIVVVRYFGGVKLGVPGLIKAYKNAAADAINNAHIVEKIATERFLLQFDYLQMNNIMTLMKEMKLAPVESNYDLRCIIVLDVRLSIIDRFIEEAEKIEGCNVERIETAYLE